MITMNDKYRFEDFGFICEPGNEDPITPNFERKTLAIPGRIGVWDFGVEEREKLFSFSIRIMERFHTRMEQKFNELMNIWFDPYGEPKPVKIVRDYEPDKYYMVKLAQQITPERLSEEGSFVLSLIANDPVKRFLIGADEIRMGSHIPILSHISPGARHSFKITGNQSIMVINDGTRAIKPRVIITGYAERISIRNAINEQSFTIENINSNKQIIVNGENYIVTEGGLETLSKLDGKFIDLLPGRNELSIRGVSMNLTISFKYRAQFR